MNPLPSPKNYCWVFAHSSQELKRLGFKIAPYLLTLIFLSPISNRTKAQVRYPALHTGIYMNCSDEMVNEMVLNDTTLFTRFRDAVRERDIDYLPDYDLQNFIKPSGNSCHYTTGQLSETAFLDAFEDFYSSIQWTSFQTQPNGTLIPRNVQIGLVIDRGEDYPIKKTCKFFVQLIGTIGPRGNPQGICKQLPHFSVERLNDTLAYIEAYLNNLMNPGDSANNREIIISEYLKSAASILIPRYSRTPNGVTLVNPVQAHPVSQRINTINVEHEFWNWNDSTIFPSKPYNNVREAFEDHMEILEAIEVLICIGNRPILLDAYEKITTVSSGSGFVVTRQEQADRIDKVADIITLVEFAESPFEAVDRLCSELKYLNNNLHATNFRILANVWRTNSFKNNCWGQLDSSATRTAPGFGYYMANTWGAYEINNTEIEIMSEYYQSVNDPNRLSCTGFGLNHSNIWNNQFIGVAWNSLGEIVPYGFIRQSNSTEKHNTFSLVSVSGQILINISDPRINISEVRVFNSAGQLVLSMENQTNLQLNNLGLKPGIYFISIEVNNNYHETLKYVQL